MEINKVNEDFVDDDTLTIKAQVQVIRYFINQSLDYRLSLSLI